MTACSKFSAGALIRTSSEIAAGEYVAAGKQPTDAECEETLRLLAAHNGNASAAAHALGIAPRTFRDRVAAARRRTAGMIVTGRSTLTDLRTGEPVMEWVKESLDRQRAAEAQQAAYAALAAELPRIASTVPPRASEGHLCNLYTYSDFHLGMLAWGKEGGADWDLKIAEQTLIDSFAAMIAQSPSAQTAILNIQGDMLHTDGLLPLTPGHKHVLDADGRFSKIVAAAIRAIRELVRMALAKHEEVHLIIAEGNHDEASSVWLRQMFTALYDQEPRISVNASELPFYAFRWGDTMLGIHHGHKVKNEQLPLLFAAQFPQMWGETTKREIHCGHRHHRDEKEYNGVTVIQHPTIAARDAYAARGGWIADRSVQSITYHKKFGQVGRVTICPEMLQ
jgi:hypothetical protein